MKRYFLIAVIILSAFPVLAQTRQYPSPDGKYCLFYDEELQEYYMHDNRLGYDYCVTCDDADDFFDDGIRPVWRVDSRYVYLSGLYDIWQIDITRALAPKKINKRKKDAPVKYFLILDGSTLPKSQTIYMKTLNTVTGEAGRASFFQKGYRYRYRNYKEKSSPC